MIEVVAYRRALDEADVLERAPEPEGGALVDGQAGDVPPLVQDAAGVGHVEAGDEVEQRRLAGAVGPDHPDDLPLADGDAHVEVGLHAAEPDGQVVRVKHGHR